MIHMIKTMMKLWIVKVNVLENYSALLDDMFK